ncbi:MAG: hypothetical protein HOP02_13495 [Methylococcaceae bacterium]|nr:hypothetical protein [Methylococcaceae bacterium]
MFVNLTLFNNFSRLAPNLLYPASNNRLTMIGLCHLLYAGFNWVFDYVLYVYVVYTWGMLLGGSVMTLISLIQCALTLKLYEKMRIDWVGAGAMLEWQSQQPTSFSGRLFHRISKKPKAAFIFLCIFTDPFIITAYFRQGRFDGLTKHDWQLFIYSGIVSNTYWICVSAILGNGIVTLWQWSLLHTNFSNDWLLTHSTAIANHSHTVWQWLLIHTH